MAPPEATPAAAGAGSRSLPLLRARTGRRPLPAPPAGEDRWLHARTLLLAVVTLAAMAVGWPVVLLVALAALVHMRLGAKGVLQALAVIVTVKYLNGAVYSFPPMFGVLAWVALLVGTARVLQYANAGAVPILASLWAFVLIVAVLTPISSPSPTISWFKLGSFAIGATGVVVAAMGLQSGEARFLRAWLPTVTLAVAVVSLPTLLLPGISRRVSDDFQGILSHPQTMGVYLAPLVTLLACRFLFRRRTFKKIDWAALALVALLLLASGTRTAVLAVVLGILGAMFMGVLRERRNRRDALRAWGLAVALGAIGVVAVGASGTLRTAALDFLFKRGAGADIEEAFMQSRGVGIESQWANFIEKPLTGHGFGVFPGGGLSMKPVMFMGLPISAPVEKGFLPTAILEEVGIPGGLGFLSLFIALLYRVYRTGDQPWAAVLLTCVFVNLGEALFFSFGGLGLYFWIWIGLAIRGTSPLGNERKRRPQVGSHPASTR